MNLNYLIKADGSVQKLMPEKLNRWAEWADVVGADWSSIALSAYRKCNDYCSSEDLQNAMIAACLDKETTACLKMANRILMGTIYKKAFGGHFKRPTVLEMYNKMVGLGLWAHMDYSEEELMSLDCVIDHDRDLNAIYPESKQVLDKYALVDRVDGHIHESPQFVWMRMALGNMEKMPKERRLNDVMKLYDKLSLKKINAPSPFCINFGTPKKQYASCCVTTTNDTAPSLAAADHIAYMMTCASAGIGAHIKTRSKGDKVRQGLIQHMGKLPYYKASQAMVGANLQSSRGGALTMHFNALDPEMDDLVALRNVQTVADKRIKDIDYSFGYNEAFAYRVAKNMNWMLVSYADAPDLYEAMYSADIDNFNKIYNRVENDNSIPKVFVSARDLVIKVLTQGFDHGRLYLHRTDTLNKHTPFLDTIYSSNLC